MTPRTIQILTCSATEYLSSRSYDISNFELKEVSSQGPYHQVCRSLEDQAREYGAEVITNLQVSSGQDDSYVIFAIALIPRNK